MVKRKIGGSLTDAQYYKRTSVIPEECTSREQLYEFMQAREKDKGLVLKSWVEEIFSNTSAEDRLLYNGKKFRISVPHFEHLRKLEKLIDFRNVIINTRQAVADALGIAPSNLNRTLHSLQKQGYIRFTTEGIRGGEIRVLINPLYAFRYTPYNLMNVRLRAIDHWNK